MSLTITDAKNDVFWQNYLKDSKWPGLIAFAVTLLFHLAAILILPDHIMRVSITKEDTPADVEYEISLVTPEELRFVEANPDAPENEPNETKQYSFRNQQAADESPLQNDANKPKVVGDVGSQKILQGSLEQSPPLEPGVYSPEARAGEGEGNEGGVLGSPSVATQMPTVVPLPAPDFIKQDPVTNEGPGSSPDFVAEAKEIFDNPVSDAPVNIYRPQQDTNEKSSSADGGGGSVDAKPTPRERPRLAPELLTGPIMNSQRSASRRGSLAIDATFSEFGEYEQQFYAAIQTGWYQEIEFFQPIDTASRVHIRLNIHSDGKVTEVKAVDTTAGEIATFICERAITERSPFRPWTQEMVKVFGDKRTLNIMFHYR